MTPREAFAKALRETRRRRRLSQEKLALAAGLSRNYVSLLERAAYSVSVDTLFLLCRVLRVRPSNMLKRVEARATKLPATRAD